SRGILPLRHCWLPPLHAMLSPALAPAATPASPIHSLHSCRSSHRAPVTNSRRRSLSGPGQSADRPPRPDDDSARTSSAAASASVAGPEGAISAPSAAPDYRPYELG